MVSLSATPLLDLAQTISNASLIVTKSQLEEQKASLHDHAVTNGINGTTKKARPLPGSAAKEVLDAKANLVQAATDLSILVLGPANYLKTLSYSVS